MDLEAFPIVATVPGFFPPRFLFVFRAVQCCSSLHFEFPTYLWCIHYKQALSSSHFDVFLAVFVVFRFADAQSARILPAQLF